MPIPAAEVIVPAETTLFGATETPGIADRAVPELTMRA